MIEACVSKSLILLAESDALAAKNYLDDGGGLISTQDAFGLTTS
jgi:hypothetical protein